MANTFKNAIDADVAATRADLYTAPGATTSILVGFTASNIDGVNDATIDVELYDSSAVTYTYLLYKAPVPAGGTLTIDNIKVVLETGDKISCTANLAGDVAAHASVLEIT